MKQAEKNIAVIQESVRVGRGCATPSSVLLGEISRVSPTSLEAFSRDREGFVIVGKHAAIRYQGSSWYQLSAENRFIPGFEATYFSSHAVPKSTDITKIDSVGFPCVLTNSQEFVFASPAPVGGIPRTSWDVRRGEHELARLSLRKLMSQGFELDHMVTMVLHTAINGTDDTLILEEGAHDTHHGKQNALSAVRRSYVGGTAKRNLGRLSSKDDWLLLPHDEVNSSSHKSKVFLRMNQYGSWRAVSPWPLTH